jgi:hypothetical protein
MPRKVILLLLFSINISFVAYAQQNNDNQLVKKITTAPDGTTAFITYDHAASNIIRLEASDNFYKYQLLDLDTNEQVYAQGNLGKRCSIDKLKIGDGTYKLKLYTKNFIISSKVTIASSDQNSVAIND